MNIELIKNYFLNLQAEICQSIEAYEDRTFQKDPWQRQAGGGGLTAVLRHGKVFEGAGVTFSHVYGDTLPSSASAHRPELAGRQFEAMGVSLVLHPRNPYVPTTHMNVRFFMAKKTGLEPVWWFGGGYDLTPYYPYKEDVIFWHRIAQQTCAPFGQAVYPRYKAWADQYFYLPHRQEPRGVGGLFFDDLNTQVWGWDFAQCEAFMRSVGDHFWLAYGPLVQKRYQTPYTQRERDFQLYRRGRYVEFNLLYDRGTLFGLQSGGRTESILMSLPPLVAWEYQWQPAAGSPEASLYEEYLVPKDWCALPTETR